MPTYKQVWKQAKKNGLTGGMSLLDFQNKMRELGSTSGNDSIARSYFYHTTPTVSKEEISDSITPKFTLNNQTQPRFFNENDFLNQGIQGLRQLSINRNSTPSTTVGTEIKQETPVVNTTQTPTSSAYWLNRAKQFGFNNIDEVKNWQREHGLTVDGLFGKNSEKKWNELNGFKESNTYYGHEDENQWKENPSSYITTKNQDKWINLWDSTGIRPRLKRLFGIKKQGGKMTYKFQQGGQATAEQNEVMKFVKALAQTLQADPNQVIQAAQQNPEALRSAAEVYNQTQDMQQAAQAFTQALQSQAQAAKHGAKLNYLKALKNQCTEDEELVYFKKGGKVDCGCRKKEDGGEMKKESSISKFKKMSKGDKVPQKFVNPNDTVHVNGKAYSLVNSDGSRADSRFPAYKGKVEEEDRKKAKAGNKDSQKRQTKQDLMSSEKKGGNLQKDCGGSKMKLVKKGDKVCPKCGKVHAAGMGCSIAKFKYRKLGGQL